MEKKTHESLERIKKDASLIASGLENRDATEFFNELADWAYANGEAMLVDNDLEVLDYEEASDIYH